MLFEIREYVSLPAQDGQRTRNLQRFILKIITERLELIRKQLPVIKNPSFVPGRSRLIIAIEQSEQGDLSP